MALYRFSAGVIARGNGHSSTAAAAYRAGERLTDERTGQTFDYSGRTGVLWTAIYAPKNAPEWMQDRSKLWNAVEQGEKRKDARTAREFIVCIPHELDLEQGRRLLGDFLREQFSRKGFVVDAAIHAPGKGGDDRNIHAHFLVTTRQVHDGRFVEKKDRTQNEKATLQQWREAWAKLGNRHLERAGHAGTLDHRNYVDQGIDRTPNRHKGKAAHNMERRGIPTETADLEKQAVARRKEIAELRAELARLEAERMPQPSRPQPANDNVHQEFQSANDNAVESKRDPLPDPPILKATPPQIAEPAEPLAIQPSAVRPPSPPPQPAFRERVEIRPPALPTPAINPTAPRQGQPSVADAPPKAEEKPAGVKVSPDISNAAATKPAPATDRKKPGQPRTADRLKPTPEQRPASSLFRELFSAAAGFTQRVYEKALHALDRQRHEPGQQPTPASDLKPPNATPPPSVPTPVSSPEKPYRMSKAERLAEQEARRLRRANKDGHGL